MARFDEKLCRIGNPRESGPQLMAQSFMMNPCGCPDAVSLNGKWNAIVDPYDRGEQMKFYLNRKPEKKSEFF